MADPRWIAQIVSTKVSDDGTAVEIKVAYQSGEREIFRLRHETLTGMIIVLSGLARDAGKKRNVDADSGEITGFGLFSASLVRVPPNDLALRLELDGGLELAISLTAESAARIADMAQEAASQLGPPDTSKTH